MNSSYYKANNLEETLKSAIKFLKSVFPEPGKNCICVQIGQKTIAHYDPENVGVWELIKYVEKQIK